ncbi:hypothetical protein RB608_06560 [Nocardioides sp. LHD-245]|uniref:hypothetical protein n=1 Tax=Nocardioides sp. LHD-245 TaxID=3051387 RepID=UPI0027DF0E38|nr:hypothetical protein [Nocardioides sp. LHD-245]
MNRPITDAVVAGLHLHEGRAELLEEIMTLAPVETPVPVRRHRRVLPVLTAAAAVLAVVAGAAWLGRLNGPEPAVDPQPAAPVSTVTAPPSGTPTPSSRADQLPPIPKRPVLIRAVGWEIGIDEQVGEVAWSGPGDARLLTVTVGNVRDPFRYDRYEDADVRREITVLGKRALLAEWKQGDVQYRAAVVSMNRTTILILEGTAMARADFLDVVGTAQRVTRADYEEAIVAATG